MTLARNFGIQTEYYSNFPHFDILGQFYHHFMTMDAIHQSLNQQLQQLLFWQHPLQLVSLTFTSTSVKITIGGVRSILIPWRGGQMIIKQVRRVRLSWRSRPVLVIWPWIAGLASRAGLSLITWRPWVKWLTMGGVVVVGGYICSCMILS